MRFSILFSVMLLAAGCSGPSGTNNGTGVNPSPKPANTNTTKKQVAVSSYEVVKTYPHDAKAFTQGLVYRDGFLYESTGEYEESTLRKVNLDTGKVLQKYDLPDDVFAEGIAI